MHFLYQSLMYPKFCHFHIVFYYQYTENEFFYDIDLLFLSVLIHPIILGMDQPTMVLTIIPYNGIQYSGGTEGGTGLKLAVKVPNLLMSKVAEESFGFIPRNSRLI
jgi:hypothetical protein